MGLLLDWLFEPETERGVRFAQPDGTWDRRSYADLSRDACEVAQLLDDVGTEPGSVISTMLGNGREFVAAFSGSLLAGCTPSPIATPIVFPDRAAYVSHVSGILRAARPRVVLADGFLAELGEEAVAAAGIDTQVVRLTFGERETAGPEAVRREAGELALLQFTSGSSGTPKGVRVTWDNLEANLLAIQRWLHWTNDDSVATWLPIYHDMGLIGTMLTPITARSNLWLMPPEEFVRDPARWIECFGREGATITAAPNFGYAYAARRVRPEQIEDHDFSTWRVAIVAAERIDPGAMRRFTELVESRGFHPRSFRPAYGLAEGTLGVTGVPPEVQPPIVKLASGHLEMGEPVEVEDSGLLGSDDAAGSGWLTGCGQPMDTTIVVDIVDEERRPVADGCFGEIRVRGSSVARGYRTADSEADRFAEDGALYTGDAGFTLDGELFVMGRIGDSLKVRGRFVYAEDVEAELCTIDGVSPGKVVVVFGGDGGQERAAAIVESHEQSWAGAVADVLRRVTSPQVAVQVLRADRGTIPRTSSGKPRRRVIWRSLIAGEFPADTVIDTAGAEAGRVPAAAAEGS